MAFLSLFFLILMRLETFAEDDDDDDEEDDEDVDEAEEQVVDMSISFSAFLAGVDFVESEVVGLKTPTAAPRDEIC